MNRNALRFFWPAAPLVLLLCGVRATAASSGVQDQAHFFSPAAITQAEQIISQIDQDHRKDLLIETFPQIPEEDKPQNDPQDRDAFFETWAISRAKSQGVNGLYILICREPAHLQVEVGHNTRQRLFTLSDRNDLIRQLLTAFKQKQFDQGLVDAARFVKQRMDSNARASAGSNSGAVAPPPAYNYPRRNGPMQAPGSRDWGLGGFACIIIAVVMGIIALRGLFGRSGGGYYGNPGGYYGGGGYPPGAYGGGYGGAGGGGFGHGFLGGLLGGAVGGYAANHWLGQGQQGGGYNAPPASGGGIDSAPDTGFSGGGGDFGSGGGGGGDFGGGGGGGGDFGGGGGGGSGGGDF